MFATIHVTPPSYQALIREKPHYRYQPVAVLEEAERVTTSKKDQGKARILEISPEAADEGIQFGMTATQGLARCEYLVLLNRDPKAEAALTNELCRVAIQFTPDFELTAAGVVTLDLRGVPEVKASTEAAKRLGEDIAEMLSACGLEAQVGFAPNPDLAFLAGKCGEPVRILKSASAIHSLPISVLDVEPSFYDILEAWGIRSLGGLVALPRDELVDRLGEFAGEIWDFAAGKRQRLLKVERPVPVFEGEIDFLDYEITALESVLFSLRRLLEELTTKLTAAYHVAEEILLRLFFSNGTEYRRRFRIAEPSRDPVLLLEIIHTQLQGVSAKASIKGLYVRATPSLGSRHQFDLFASSVRDPNKLSETLTRLEALLGTERVGKPSPLPSHRPAGFEVFPFDAAGEPEFQAKQHAIKGTAFRRFRPRLPVRVEFGKLKIPGVFDASEFFVGSKTAVSKGGVEPSAGCLSPNFIKGALVSAGVVERLGPWRFSGDWWEETGKWRREEWDVTLETGGLFRIVQEGGAWFLEGMYA